MCHSERSEESQGSFATTHDDDDINMPKNFSCFLILIVIIFLTNFSFAFFTDEETKQANGFEVGILDFSLDQIATSSLNNITPSQSGHLNLVVEKEGSLDFQYQISASDLSGELCDYLNLKSNLNGDLKWQGLLSSFSYQASSTQSFKDWSFNFSLTSQDESLFQKSCSFKLLFEAWQLNLENNSQGFYKNRELELTLSSGTWRDGVFLNEFLPNPDGAFGNDADPMPLGEWVELYNLSDQPIDVAGWTIKDEADHSITITATNTGGSTPASVGITVVSPYTAWSAQYGLLQGMEGDDDGDGSRNYFEFIAGLVPTNAGSVFKISVSPVPGQLSQRAIVMSPIISGRTYTVKSSESLSPPTWISLSNPPSSDAGNVRTVTDTAATEAKKFYVIEISFP